MAAPTWRVGRHCGGRSLRRDYDGTSRCLTCGRPLDLCEGCGVEAPPGTPSVWPWCGPPCRRAALAKRRSLQLAREANQGVP